MAAPVKTKQVVKKAPNVDYRLKRSTISTATLCAILLITGASLLVWQTDKWAVLGLIIACTTMLTGAIQVLTFFYAEAGYCTKSTAVQGFVSLALGTAILFTSGITAYSAYVPYAMIAWAVISGIVQAIASGYYRQQNDPAWGWVLAQGILSITFATALIFHSMFIMDITVRICGVYLMVWAMFAIGLHKSIRHVKRRRKKNAAAMAE